MSTGPVRIIERNREETPAGRPQIDITGVEAITAGDIVAVPTLCAELVDPVQTAGGLIFHTRTGLTGRGPVFARQHEIPAVIGCPWLPTELNAGEQVTVDAEEGKIIRYD